MSFYRGGLVGLPGDSFPDFSHPTSEQKTSD
jgi:hypothetical protein